MIGKDFGQHEPLTTRLHNLVRSYPKGVGIFKEFIQNADDAEASKIIFVIDEQQYNTNGLPESMIWLHNTPALLVYNNKSFNDKDIQDIQTIGKSGKSDSVGKTGRFGLGFNACYNVTDVPYFLTRGGMYFFDPHLQTIFGASAGIAGRVYEVDEIVKEGWPLLDSFYYFIDEKYFCNGAVFRLPFRTDQQAEKSEIKKDAYSIDDAFNAVKELQDMGSAILLFLKHVKHLKVEYRNKDGIVKELLSMEANNLDEIKESRAAVNDLLRNPDTISVFTSLSNIADDLYSVCNHEYSVVIEGAKRTEKWRVVDGFFVDDEQIVLKTCKKMIDNEEKALPYAGVAWPMIMDRPPPGRLYCFLPVPVHTTMPVQINGYFDLDDSRQNLFLDPSAHGSAGIRVDWNKILLEICVVKAYICLLEDLRADFDNNNLESYYEIFPNVIDDNKSWEGWLTSKFYQQASVAELYRVSGNNSWCTLANIRTLPLTIQSIENVLSSENIIPIPKPSIPDHVRNGFIINQIEIPELTPAELRAKLKEQLDVDCLTKDAPRACLKKLSYIKTILRFCLSDSPGEDIIGLPLVIDYRKRLRTLGFTKYPLYLTDQTQDLEVFGEHPEWFVDPQFAEEMNLKEAEVAELYFMDSKLFVKELSKYVSMHSKNGALRLITGKAGPFTDLWLQAVFTRLLVSNLDDITETLESIPLIPDQFQVLHNMGSASTPLLYNERNDKLKEALIELSVPLVTGISDKLLELLLNFSEEKEHLIWQVTILDLIDTLYAECAEVIQEYDQFTKVQEALLNYFSKDDNLESLKEDENGFKKLKTLKLFPTVNSELVNLTKKAYIAQGFQFPQVYFDVAMLDDGPSGRWRGLYILYDIPQLSSSRFIEDLILPSFNNLNDEVKGEASKWLRDNLNIALNELKSDESDELFEKIQSTPIIVCEDGAIHAPKNVYQPESNLVREVLGDHALFPDMNTVYSSQKEQWLAFFRQLNMPTEPCLHDVVEYVDAIIDGDIPVDQKANSFKAVYKFIKERVEKAIQQKEEIPEELIESLDSLAEMDWIPVRQEGRDLLCFKPPEAFFASPAEIYFPREGQLIASQAYITTLIQEPIQRVRKEMGFPENPPIKLVVYHFKELLALCSSQELMPSETELVKVLSQIFRYFGTEIPGEDDESAEAMEDQGEVGIVDLKSIFSDTPCIYDKEIKVFWRPNHLFREKVSYMEPWRKTIRFTEDAIERGLTALGRREEPFLEDWKQVLIEISESVNSISENSISEIIRELLRRIVEELDQSNDIDREVLVPTQLGKMLPAGSVYMGDAPWYDSVLDSCDIPILSSSVSDIRAITRRLKVSSLAKSIEQRIVENPVESDLIENVQKCLDLENLLQSEEFIIALQRLIRHEDHEVSQKELLYLHDIKVKCVKAIRSHLYLCSNGTKQFLTEYDTDWYWDHKENIAMLSENRQKYFHDDLAALLKRSLGDTSLKDLAPLVKLFQCVPAEISEVLDDLRIRKCTIETEENYEDDEELVMQDNSGEDLEIAQDSVDDITEELTGPQDDEGVPWGDEVPIYEDKLVETSATIESLQQEDHTIQPHGTSTASRAKVMDKEDTEDFSKEEGLVRTPRAQSPSSPGVDRPVQDNQKKTDLKSRLSEDNMVSPQELAPSKRQPGRQQRLLTYVSHKTDNDITDHDEYEKDDHSLRIGEEAVRIVIEYETMNGRKATAMHHSNPGFDVISEHDGEMRYIEVKGTEEAWGERGVTLSAKQFFYAKENQKHNYWLYVVENVFSEKAQIYKIYNPIDKVEYFAFDSGWTQAAEDSEVEEDKKLNILPGDEVLENGKVVGTVESVMELGKLPLVSYRTSDGSLLKKLLSELTFHPKEEE